MLASAYSVQVSKKPSHRKFSFIFRVSRELSKKHDTLTFVTPPAVAHCWLKMWAWSRTGSRIREREQLNLGNGAHSTPHSTPTEPNIGCRPPWHPAQELLKSGICKTRQGDVACVRKCLISATQSYFQWQAHKQSWHQNKTQQLKLLTVTEK